ncbi:MAG: hypothetical protein Ct9H90mP16_00230 [Candidatus Poseidoniales archaeon]|nr:MAG: hypothetical protein Ct9H90mP16_00230 [Candidatus Poseidoniales archaeon]
MAGDAVAICDSNGVVDEAIVGGMKIESRPFLIIRFEQKKQGGLGQTFVQQAETCPLFSLHGEMPSVTSLNVGDSVLVQVDSSARHIGKNILSGVEER